MRISETHYLINPICGVIATRTQEPISISPGMHYFSAIWASDHFGHAYFPRQPLARFEKLDVDQNRRDPRHYDDSDLLPHRHEAPTPRQKGRPGTPGETTGPATPSKLTAHYTPLSPICNVCAGLGARMPRPCQARGRSISKRCWRRSMQASFRIGMSGSALWGRKSLLSASALDNAC
jgi:hypothetical protein